MSNLLFEAKQRLASIAVECMAALSTPVVADAKPYYWHTQEAFPYFTVRTGTDEISYDSEDFDRDTYTLLLRLVIGHITSGYKGEREQELDTWIPALKTYINNRENLQSASYTTALSGLIRARVVRHTGFVAFQNTGLSAQQVGAEFSVECEFDETLSQAYL